jgi:flagellar assembly factor FliW
MLPHTQAGNIGAFYLFFKIIVNFLTPLDVLQCKMVFKKIIFNGTQYQSITAKTCGHHCIFFSVHRAQGKSLTSIKEMYSKIDMQRNDDMVFNFVWNNFGKMFAEYDFI